MNILTETILNSDNYLTPIQYNKVSHNRDIKNAQFLASKVCWDSNKKTLTTIKYNKDWHLNQSYIYNTLKIDELNQQCIDNDMTPIFLTLTLPSEYHPTTTKRGFREPNENYNPFLSAKDGYDKLIEIYRDLYNNFRIDRKKVKGLKFIRVIEPHEDFTPHLHAVIYVPLGLNDNFKNHFDNIVSKNSLKRVDYKVLKKVKYATTYLLKYVQKTLEGNDIIRGWAIHHKINRVLTTSNLNNGLNREVFKRVSSLVEFNKGSDLNYFRQILDKVYIKRTLINALGDVQKIKYYGNPKSQIFIDYSILRVRKINDFNGFISIDYNDNDEFSTLIHECYFENDILYEHEIDSDIYGSYSYKLDKLLILRDNKMFYDSRCVKLFERRYYYGY